MTSPWTAENAAHRDLDISLENARCPHSHRASSLRSVDNNVGEKGTS